MRRRTAATACTVFAFVNLACGRERIEPPDTARPAVPAGISAQAYPEAGIFFDRPANWGFRPGPPPLVASASSGTATVAVWRYLRSEPLPEGDEALQTAQRSLEDAARARDSTFTVQEGRRLEIDGAPAIQLVGTESVAGSKRRVRSTHVFAKGAEVVVDSYAPEGEFARVDREVFTPIVESLRIDPPEGGP